MWTQADLIPAFTQIGITAGDTLFVHSSLRRLGPAEHGADGIIDALLAAVGSNGTVAVPTHTWGTVNELQPVFHPILSPSIVGALTNVFRQRPDALRSLHPTHSVAALGMRAEELVRGHELEDTPCSPTSPYGKLVTWGGKILFIGVGLQYCTFFHGCEEWAECPWLFKPAPEMYYSITAEGKVIPVPSRRHTHNVRRCYPILETPLREAGILQDGRVGECPLLLLDARRAAEWLVPRLRKNPYLLVEGGAINS